VPDYPKLAQLWWKNVAVAVTGEKTPQAAMDNLAEEMDQVMAARACRHGPLRTEAATQGRPEQVPDRQGQRRAKKRRTRSRRARQIALRHLVEPQWRPPRFAEPHA
jgi:hypothetical protein